jgi:hypothetical protein
MLDLVSPAVALGILPAIVGIHALYFRTGSRTSTQHRFRVVDEARATGLILSVEGNDAGRRTVRPEVVSLVARSKVEGDLHVDDDRHYRSPLKVTGDLVVEGHAVFDAPVVVNGYVRISGEAVFSEGLLVKSDMLVTGIARFGKGGSGSWCVARKITGRIVPVAVASDDNVKHRELLSA